MSIKKNILILIKYRRGLAILISLASLSALGVALFMPPNIIRSLYSLEESIKIEFRASPVVGVPTDFYRTSPFGAMRSALSNKQNFGQAITETSEWFSSPEDLQEYLSEVEVTSNSSNQTVALLFKPVSSMDVDLIAEWLFDFVHTYVQRRMVREASRLDQLITEVEANTISALSIDVGQFLSWKINNEAYLNPDRGYISNTAPAGALHEKVVAQTDRRIFVAAGLWMVLIFSFIAFIYFKEGIKSLKADAMFMSEVRAVLNKGQK